jgi:diguanylate cyclase (GGDEF)-like protein/PAS domain S-box-containing protein
MERKIGLPAAGSDLFFKRLIDNLYDAVYFVTCDRQITYWNRAAEQLSGYAASEVIGTHCSQNLMHVDEAGHNLCKRGCPLRAAIRKRKPQEAELYLRHKDGHRVPVSVRAQPVIDSRGRVIGAVEIFSDNTRYQQAQHHLHKLHTAAFTDELTKLYNRRYLERTLERLLSEMQECGARFGLLFIDVDHFKRVNDRHGHDAGDAVLAATAKTLAASLRHGDILGRWGGDEFLAILPGVNESALRKLAERCRILVERSAARGKIRVTVSLGGAVAHKGEVAPELLKRADAQLLSSKRRGRNRSLTQEFAGKSCAIR